MAVVVLDSSAVIAYLRGEPGKERVAAALLDDTTSCRMHAVNLCEVFYDTLRASGESVADQVLKIWRRWAFRPSPTWATNFSKRPGGSR